MDVSRNFEQLATDLDRIRFGSKSNGSPPLNNNTDLAGYNTRPLSSSSSGGSSTSTHGGNKPQAPSGGSGGHQASYEPYWRDASFYKRRYEDAEETGGTKYQIVRTRKEGEEEEEQRDERGLRVTRNREALPNGNDARSVA
uniref:Uncharacterized protein n=1 Tax=Pristionchus pacificus TaxID=54126 RepID=A0A2A6CEP5_PRIPA|eukprot:PDM76481.1 hypothetical protein PRIPAC_42847 [Pristionchus pacificus]